MFVVTVDFQAKSDKVEEFRDAILFQARSSREHEPGCLYFDVCVDPQDPAHFCVYEIYQDEAAFTAHRESEHSAITRDRVADLLERRQLSTWTKIDG